MQPTTEETSNFPIPWKSIKQEIAYITGMIDGDGSVHKTQMRLSITNTDKSIIDVCQQILRDLQIEFRTYAHAPRCPTSHSIWDIYVNKKASLARAFIQLPLNSPHKISRLREKAHQTSHTILGAEPLDFNNPEQAAGYLAGLIDSEGRIDVTNRYIRITNCDKSLLQNAIMCCKTLNVTARLRERKDSYQVNTGNLRVYDVWITHRDNYRKILMCVPLQMCKFTLLKNLINTYTPAIPSFYTLYNLYCVKKLDARAIGNQLGATGHGTVTSWLKAYAIPLRGRAESVKLGWEKRKKSTLSTKTLDL